MGGVAATTGGDVVAAFHGGVEAGFFLHFALGAVEVGRVDAADVLGVAFGEAIGGDVGLSALFRVLVVGFEDVFFAGL